MPEALARIRRVRELGRRVTSRWTAASTRTTRRRPYEAGATCSSRAARSSARGRCRAQLPPARRACSREPRPRARARRARRAGTTHPKPTVGAVVVRDGEVVGEGVTEPAGGAHGEVVALARGRRAGARRDALRDDGAVRAPRARRRRAPTRVLAAGVARVVAGSLDPNPRRGRRARAAPRPRASRSSSTTASRRARQNEAWRTWVAARAAVRHLQGRGHARRPRHRARPALGDAARRAGASCTSCARQPTRSRSGWGRCAPTRRGSTRATSPVVAAAAPARVRPRPAARRVGARAAHRARSTRSSRALGARGRAVAAARGRADARDVVPRRAASSTSCCCSSRPSSRRRGADVPRPARRAGRARSDRVATDRRRRPRRRVPARAVNRRSRRASCC